jgi:hypothetical protein
MLFRFIFGEEEEEEEEEMLRRISCNYFAHMFLDVMVVLSSLWEFLHSSCLLWQRSTDVAIGNQQIVFILQHFFIVHEIKAETQNQ